MIPINIAASSWRSEVECDVLKGKTITSIEGLKVGSEQIQFNCSDGSKYVMGRAFTNLEPVEVLIDDICGDIDDLIGSPIVIAEENYDVPGGPRNTSDKSWTWVFYKFATTKGYVDIKWYGTSDGRYTEHAEMYVVR